MKKTLTLATLAALALTGCATPETPEYETQQVGALTVTYRDGCAIQSVDPDGYTATAGFDCLSTAEIIALPHYPAGA